MRFGHSMPRSSYFLAQDEQQLDDLVDHNQIEFKGPLPEKYKVDWGVFFQGASQTAPSALTAQPIDTGITPALLEIRLPTFALFNLGIPPVFLDQLTSERADDTTKDKAVDPMPGLPLPWVTMIRGTGLRLPSGQTVAAALGERVLTSQELTCSWDGSVSEQGQILLDQGLVQNTPLWYYVLKESELRHNGACLGRTGSRIVAETIFASLMHDPDSYVNHPAAGLRLPEWEFPSGHDVIRSLGDLFSHSDELASF